MCLVVCFNNSRKTSDSRHKGDGLKGGFQMIEVTWVVTENGVIVGHEKKLVPSERAANNLVKYLKQFATCERFSIFNPWDLI